MDGVDIGLFDRDWHNTLYFFALNADEQIYLRYGGRDSRSQDSYLNLSSLELALQQGLELHRLYREGRLQKTERPKPLFPREIPLLVERTAAINRCVECHLIGDFLNLQREQNGTLDKLSHMYRSPDIRRIGIELDVPRGLVVKQVSDPVESAGMRAGDRIVALEGTPVWTFGDLQYWYDKIRRDARTVSFTVERQGNRIPLSVSLPERWWWTDITYRESSVDPRVYFDSRPLTDAEKQGLGLRRDGFASAVTRSDMFAQMMKSHDLKVGDVIYSVDGTERDDIANTAELYIKLRKTAGDLVTLGVIRDGARMSMKLTTYRLGFRK